MQRAMMRQSSGLAQGSGGLRGPRPQGHRRDLGSQVAGLGQVLQGRGFDLPLGRYLRVDPHSGHG